MDLFREHFDKGPTLLMRIDPANPGFGALGLWCAEIGPSLRSRPFQAIFVLHPPAIEATR